MFSCGPSRLPKSRSRTSAPPPPAWAWNPPASPGWSALSPGSPAAGGGGPMSRTRGLLDHLSVADVAGVGVEDQSGELLEGLLEPEEDLVLALHGPAVVVGADDGGGAELQQEGVEIAPAERVQHPGGRGGRLEVVLVVHTRPFWHLRCPRRGHTPPCAEPCGESVPPGMWVTGRLTGSRGDWSRPVDLGVLARHAGKVRCRKPRRTAELRSTSPALTGRQRDRNGRGSSMVCPRGDLNPHAR